MRGSTENLVRKAHVILQELHQRAAIDTVRTLPGVMGVRLVEIAARNQVLALKVETFPDIKTRRSM